MLSSLFIPVIDAADTVPYPPFSLVAHRGDGQITVSWMQYEDDIVQYKVYRSTTSGNEMFLANVFLADANSARSYVDRAVTNGQIYYYKVSAVNAFGESGLSSQEVAAVPSNAPASIAVDSPTGSPGANIPVSGSGFDSNALLSHSIDGTGYMWNVRTDPYGSFSTTFRVPNIANGSHVLSVTDGASSADATFAVGEPVAVLGMERAAPGIDIPVSGYGFHANSYMDLWVGTIHVLWSARTDASGAFSGTVNLREQDVSTGTVSLEFRDDEGFSAFVDILIGEPIVELGMDRAAPGVGVPVTGYGFHASSEIIFSIGSSDILWSARTDASGAFSGTVSLREQDVIIGTNTLSFRDRQGFSGSASILIGEPVVELGMDRAAPGVGIPVSGYGFHADSAITFFIGSQSILWPGHTDATGAFSGIVNLREQDVSTGMNTLEFRDQQGYSGSAEILIGEPIVELGMERAALGVVVPVTGYGFHANSYVSIWAGTFHALWNVETDASGAFSATVTLDDAFVNDGINTLEFRDGQDYSAFADILVGQPVITLGRSGGGPQSTVAISGYGFAPGAPLYLYFGSAPRLWPVTTDSNGAFSSSFIVPSDALGGSNTVTVSDGTHQASADFNVIYRDRVAPVTTADLDGISTSTGWYTSDVTVKLLATDAGSGVYKTQYRIGFLSIWKDYTEPFTMIRSGTVYFKSTDIAGNEELAKRITVTIDRAPPLSSASAAGTLGMNEWYTTDVTVTLSTTDGQSGTVETQYRIGGGDWTPYSVPFALTEEGITTVEYASVDNAGNTEAVKSLVIKIDKTAPTIDIGPIEQANPYGWYDHTVDVEFTATDAVSGIVQPTYSYTFAAEGAAQSISWTAMDQAGNTATSTVEGINIDMTAPTGQATPLTAPNDNGWYNSDVTMVFTLDGDLSGIDLAKSDPLAQIISAEGRDLTASITVCDLAGNTFVLTSPSVNLDKTAPTGTAAPSTSPNAAGWYNSDVTMTFHLSDGLSGISGTTDPSATISAEGRDMTASVVATDLAGNTAVIISPGVDLDKTAPTGVAVATTAPNAAGWYRSDVTMVFALSDELSGIDGPSSPTVIISTEGIGVVGSAVATDQAGNTARILSPSINLDKTAPEIVIATPWADDRYVLNEQVDADYGCIDTLSGLDVVVDSGAIDTSSVGTKYFTVTSTDRAGNANTMSVAYHVGYDFGGLSSSLTDRTFRAGSTIPLKFQLVDADGNFVSNANAQVFLDGVAATPAGSSSSDNTFRYDADGNQYVFNLSTKGLGSGTHTITIVLDDGSRYEASVKLR